MEKLNNLINELEQHILFLDKTNAMVSKAALGWHIEHSLKVLTQIIGAVEQSTPENYKRKFNLNRMIFLGLNFIPRGKGKAPKSVFPEGEITTASLKKHLERAKGLISKMDILKPNNHFKHPYFGDLNLQQTKKFIALHTNHHLKIIKDIIR
jgi:hypothetical protein